MYQTTTSSVKLKPKKTEKRIINVKSSRSLKSIDSGKKSSRSLIPKKKIKTLADLSKTMPRFSDYFS